MPHDLQMLVWSACLALILVVIAVLLAANEVGLPTLAGNREGMAPLPGLAGRANGVTATGATLFFWGRLVHAIIYLAGIPWARTAAWAVSFVGIIMVASQLL